MELDEVLEYSQGILESENRARESALKLSRECIRHCGRSIRAAHRDDEDKSEELLSRARETLSHAQEALEPFPRVYYAGFLQDAEKEYAEAATTRAVMKGERLPMPDELGVDVAPYLNGLGEMAGEMRRHALDLMRSGDLHRAERVLGVMDDIFSLLASIDYPDALTGGLRRTNDMVRGVTERTRSDLASAIRASRLEQSMKDLEDKL